MKLREINEQMERIENLLAENGGEFTDEIQTELNNLEMGESDKLENIGFMIQECKTDSEKFKIEIDRLTKVKKQLDNKQKSLKEFASWYLNQKGYDKFNAGLVKYSFRTSKTVDISDVNTLPMEYIITEKKADKKALKEAILVGETIAGVELVVNKNIQIK